MTIIDAIGALIFLGCMLGAVWYIRTNGKGRIGEWLREKWPKKLP